MPRLTYFGHSAFLVEGGGARIVIDPFLTGNPQTAVAPGGLRVDYVLLTHGHGDHLGDGVEIATSCNALLVAPFELANYCAARGARVHPMHIGGSRAFPFGRVKLTIAHHGSSAPDGSYTGNPCGFLLSIDGRTLYHAGDTGLFLDMQLIGEMNPIDVALLPIGDNFTMGVADAVKATELLRPKLVIPMHYKTFEVIDVEPKDFVNSVREHGFEGRLLNAGQSFDY